MFLLFQAIANESGINFISVKGPELLNMVGKDALSIEITKPFWYINIQSKGLFYAS